MFFVDIRHQNRKNAEKRQNLANFPVPYPLPPSLTTEICSADPKRFVNVLMRCIVWRNYVYLINLLIGA